MTTCEPSDHIGHLPEGWVRCIESSTGDEWYQHGNESQWTRPPYYLSNKPGKALTVEMLQNPSGLTLNARTTVEGLANITRRIERHRKQALQRKANNAAKKELIDLGLKGKGLALIKLANTALQNAIEAETIATQSQLEYEKALKEYNDLYTTLKHTFRNTTIAGSKLNLALQPARNKRNSTKVALTMAINNATKKRQRATPLVSIKNAKQKALAAFSGYSTMAVPASRYAKPTTQSYRNGYGTGKIMTLIN